MLQVDLEYVLDLEHLAHPGRTKVSVILRLRVAAVISFVERLHSWDPHVLIHDCFRGTVHQSCRLFTTIFFHRRNLELEVLRFLFASTTAFLFHGFQVGDKCVVVT